MTELLGVEKFAPEGMEVHVYVQLIIVPVKAVSCAVSFLQIVGLIVKLTCEFKFKTSSKKLKAKNVLFFMGLILVNCGTKFHN